MMFIFLLRKPKRILLITAIIWILTSASRSGYDSKFVRYIKEVEGGLSRKTTDSASSNPSPYVHQGKNGWHTNKGVTWTTFTSYADTLGYTVNRSNFISMPDSIWHKIMNNVYLDSYPLKQINHLPRIKAVISDWCFHSGRSGSERYLADFQRDVFNVNDSNITKNEIVSNFKRYVNRSNELYFFELLLKRRLDDFRSMGGWLANKNGWINRLDTISRHFK